METLCAACGAAIPPGKKFCTSCGAPATAEQVATPQHDPPPSAPPPPEPPQEIAPPSDAAYPGAWLSGDSASDRPRSGAATDEPVFEISVEDKKSGVYSQQEPGPGRESVFEQKPWLVPALCLGFIALVSVVSLFAVIRNKHHAVVKRRALPAVKPAPSAIIPPGAPCATRLEKALGAVLVQPRQGVNYFPIKPGQCVPDGAHVSTGPGARALLAISDAAVKIHINSNTEISHSALQGKRVSVSLVKGEAFVSSPDGAALDISTPHESAAAPSGGKFHLMLSRGTEYITCIAGGASTTRGIALAPGAQYVIAGADTSRNSLKTVPLDKFIPWVNEWKDDFAPPRPKTATSTGAPGAPEQSPRQMIDENSAVIQAAATGYPDKVPKDSQFDIVVRGGSWAIVVIKDTRENAQDLEDYRPPIANLLKKANGHWIWLESFKDYSEDLFILWEDKYGFDKKAEAELKLSY